MTNTPLYLKEETGCWTWLRRSRMSNGYGIIRREGRSQSAHRWFYEQKYGKIPEGLQLDHLCRKRDCVNPDHLEIVTHAENGRRGSNAKITMEKAREIRELRARTGMVYKDIGLLYGLAETSVRSIVFGLRWNEEVVPR